MKEFLKKQVPVTTVLIIIAIMAVAPSMCAQMFKMMASEIGYDDTVTQLGLYGESSNVQKAIEAVDSNIDNIHLVTGPTGPTGIEGPTGATGPNGNFIESVLIASSGYVGYNVDCIYDTLLEILVYIPSNTLRLEGKFVVTSFGADCCVVRYRVNNKESSSPRWCDSMDIVSLEYPDIGWGKLYIDANKAEIMSFTIYAVFQ